MSDNWQRFRSRYRGSYPTPSRAWNARADMGVPFTGGQECRMGIVEEGAKEHNQPDSCTAQRKPTRKVTQ